MTRRRTINSPLKVLVSLCLIGLSLVISGCGLGGNMGVTENSDPSADEVFEELYHTVTVAMATNGYGPQFRWKNKTQPFPYEQASWADPTAFGCDEDGTKRLRLKATTTGQGLGTENIQERVEKVKAAWEAMGLKVSRVGASDILSEIAVTLSHGTVVTYSSTPDGEWVNAKTPCFAEFAGDKSTATVFPAKYSP